VKGDGYANCIPSIPRDLLVKLQFRPVWVDNRGPLELLPSSLKGFFNKVLVQK